MNCDFLDNLLPGDLAMADRGFDIEESVALYCTKVKIPSFTKGKRKLNNLDVELWRRIAAVTVDWKGDCSKQLFSFVRDFTIRFFDGKRW